MFQSECPELRNTPSEIFKCSRTPLRRGPAIRPSLSIIGKPRLLAPYQRVFSKPNSLKQWRAQGNEALALPHVSVPDIRHVDWAALRRAGFQVPLRPPSVTLRLSPYLSYVLGLRFNAIYDEQQCGADCMGFAMVLSLTCGN